MSDNNSGARPDDRDGASWATESLPMSVRKEMLERELSQLGFRKAAAHSSGSADTPGRSHQQHGDGGSSHPQADAGDASGRP
jgi:hypothetical protein